MTEVSYTLHSIGFTGTAELDDFLINSKAGDIIDVKIDGTNQVLPLQMVEKIYENHGEVSHFNEYETETVVHSVILVDNMLYLAGHDEEDSWYVTDDNYLPDKFISVSSYAYDSKTKTFTAQEIRSLREREVKPTDSKSSTSRFGGWPVDSAGQEIKEWPHVKGTPLIFQAQKQLPDGRMVWVFADGVEALQTVLPMEKDPEWSSQKHYVEGMYGAEYFDIYERLYSRDRWHYDNKEFLGQKQPIHKYFKNYEWKDNGIAVLVEGGTIPTWITMKKPISDMKPFLTVSELAVSFPVGDLHVPHWIQAERDDAYEYPLFLFQIDNGVGGLEYDYGDDGTLYVYWNGKDAGVGLIQCY